MLHMTVGANRRARTAEAKGCRPWGLEASFERASWGQTCQFTAGNIKLKIPSKTNTGDQPNRAPAIAPADAPKARDINSPDTTNPSHVARRLEGAAASISA